MILIPSFGPHRSFMMVLFSLIGMPAYTVVGWLGVLSIRQGMGERRGEKEIRTAILVMWTAFLVTVLVFALVHGQPWWDSVKPDNM